MDRFRAMQAFVRIVEGGSLSAAARALGVSLPAVVRTLAGLEEHLGTRLLNRTTRRLSLTDAGHQYYERARQIIGEVEEAELSVSAARRRPAGTLSLTAPVVYGRLKLLPVLAEYRRRFPEVAVRLLLLDRNVNLSLSVIAPGEQWRFLERARELSVRIRPAFLANSADAVIGMAQAGAGIGMALSYQVEAALAQRKLRLVLEEFAPPPVPVNALYPHGRLTAAKLREFLALAAALLGERSRTAAL